MDIQVLKSGVGRANLCKCGDPRSKIQESLERVGWESEDPRSKIQLSLLRARGVQDHRSTIQGCALLLGRVLEGVLESQIQNPNQGLEREGQDPKEKMKVIKSKIQRL